MFRGLNPLVLDGKGRMAIPTKLRDALMQRGGGTLVVTLHPKRCLMLYGLADWELIEAAFHELPSFHPLAQDLQDMLVGNATEVEMDGTGRVLLPQIHRNYAKLEKDVVMVGKGTRFDIWNTGAWETRMDGMGDLTTRLDEAQRNGALPDALRDFRL